MCWIFLDRCLFVSGGGTQDITCVLNKHVNKGREEEEGRAAVEAQGCPGLCLFVLENAKEETFQRRSWPKEAGWTFPNLWVFRSEHISMVYCQSLPIPLLQKCNTGETTSSILHICVYRLGHRGLARATKPLLSWEMSVGRQADLGLLLLQGHQ